MAVLARVTRQVSLAWSIGLLLLWIHISLMPACSQGTFVLREHENNEVIFVEERITLECRAPGHVSNPQFKLLDSQNNVLVDQDFMFYADDHIGYPDPDGGANYAITLKSVIQNRYLCEISGDNGVLSTEEVNLNVFPRDSPQCFMNTSASVTVGEVIGLSCYQEVGMVPNSGFRWRQILRDRTVYEQLLPEYSDLINQFKRKLSTSIIASLNDEGSEFECVIMDSDSEKTCSTGEISIQQSQELELTISPNRVYSLDRGESQTFSCESSDPRYNILWVRNAEYQNTDANVDISGSVVSVRIPTDTTIMNGVVLTFVCTATFGESTKSEILLVSINFESNLNPLPTVTTSTQPTQVMLTFTPATVPPLSRGDIVEVECTPSLENYNVSWITVGSFNVEVQTDLGGSTLRIRIPVNITLMSEAVLNFACVASFNGAVVSRQLTVKVLFVSPTNMSNAPTVNVNDMRDFITDENDNTSPGFLPVVITCSIIFACFIVLIANVLFFRKRVLSLHCKETGMKSAESNHEATNDVFYCKNISHNYDQTFQNEGQVSEMSAINPKGSLSEASSSVLYCRNILEGHGLLYARNIPQEYGGERRHVEITGDSKHEYYECKPAITGKSDEDVNYIEVVP